METGTCPSAGDHVLIGTGAHAGRTGTVSRILNGPGTPLDAVPPGSPQHYPYWYVIGLGDGAGTVRLTRDQFTGTAG